jgi:type II secretory pathway pseudopilin PulG
MGLLLTQAARVWSVTQQRERETQLLFAGDAFRMAVSGYFAGAHQYPHSLQDLLGDPDSPIARRFLRRLYPDPMTNSTDWELIYAADGAGIIGVASRSKAVPIKRKGFSLADSAFEDTECYCDWRFVYSPRGIGRPIKPAALSTQ